MVLLSLLWMSELVQQTSAGCRSLGDRGQWKHSECREERRDIQGQGEASRTNSIGGGFPPYRGC